FVALWDASTGEAIEYPPAHRQPVDGVTVSPDGRTIATASSRERKICLWDARDGTLRRAIAVPSAYGMRLDCFRFSPDGTTLTMAGSHWEAASGKLLNGGRFPRDVYADIRLFRSSLSADETLLLVRPLHESAVRVWDAANNTPLYDVAAPDPTRY